jgi:phenylacetate-coenzyme A ligase PaaK-like adenylate-forming protein
MRTEPCSCGRTFRQISELEGRVEDILPLTDGTFVHPRAIWQVFKADPEVLQYQLTQHDLQRFALTLVTVDGPAFERALARARPGLERLLGAGATIEVTRRSHVDRGGAGKFRAVASLCTTGAVTPHRSQREDLDRELEV